MWCSIVGKRMAYAILGLIVSLWLIIPCAQAETKTLQRDTKLHPQGWAVGDVLEFKKGTVLTTNDIGEVITGTLKEDTFLQPRGWERVINDYYYVTAYAGMSPFFPRYHRIFPDRSYNIAIPGYGHLLYKGGNPVTFNLDGEVLSGTLADTATVRLVAGKYGFLTFRENTVLSFYGSGAVKSGVLDTDTSLRPAGWQKNHAVNGEAGFVKFSAKKAIVFNEAGEVTTGTLKETLQWRSAAGETVEFPAHTAIRFDEQESIAEPAGQG